MKPFNLVLFAVLLTGCSVICGVGQTRAAAKVTPPPLVVSDAIKSSPAYAELLLRKTELSAELESLILEYTEEYPKVRESRYAIALLDRDLTRIATIKPTDSGKLTLALGKLMLRRVELETDLGMLLRTFKDEHPDVKRLKKKIEIYEAAIKEILG
jgi:uncharacterized protein involved in exopolysaccharide biosynthesis